MLSFDQIKDMIRAAIKGQLGNDYVYIVELYADSVVYEVETAGTEQYFKRSYAIVDGAVQLGDAAQVQKRVDYIPLQAAARLLAAVGSPEDADYGFVWRTQVVEYGPGKDGRINWPKEPLVAALHLYDGAKVFVLNESQHHAAPKPFGKSVREIVGWLKNPVDTGTGIEADLYILKSARWLRDALVDSHERGCPNLFGLSHDVSAKAKTVMVAGRKMKEPVTITAVEVDVVHTPTNNGKFIRMAAAAAAESEDDVNREQLLAALKKARPNLDTDNMTDEALLQALTAAVIENAGGDAANEKLTAAVVEGLKKIMTPGEPPAELLELRQMRAAMLLDRELTASKLPEIAAAKLRRRFEGQEFTVETLQAAIKEEKEMIDHLTGSGAVRGTGEARVVRDSAEKLQAACDKLFGVAVDGTLADIAPFRSLRAAYVEITGDTEVRGYLAPEQVERMHAAFGSATFSYVLGNTLYRRLVMDYKEIGDYGVSLLVGGNIRNARDFRTLESVRIGYYGDLPDVNPEVADYADLGVLSDEEVSYALNQKGGIITINRKMIINDDMRAVQKIISRLPRAARRTLAKRCWNKLVGNATYKGDNKAMFHEDHGNLGTAALSTTALAAAKRAFSKQVEPGSNERLDLRPRTLVLPSELWATGKKINRTQGEPGSPNFGNAFYQYFGANDENIFECPFMTDATDWMLLGDPNECEILELAFLNGQQEPEMFVADNPGVGQMFLADQIQYKIRHEYETEIVDFRNAYKAVVAG